MTDTLRTRLGRAAAVAALVAAGLGATVAAAPVAVAAAACPPSSSTPSTIVSRSWCPPPCRVVKQRVKKWYGWRTVSYCVR